MAALLAYASLILEPDFEWTAGCGLGEFGVDQIGEVFLKAASAWGSFLG